MTFKVKACFILCPLQIALFLHANMSILGCLPSICILTIKKLNGQQIQNGYQELQVLMCLKDVKNSQLSLSHKN